MKIEKIKLDKVVLENQLEDNETLQYLFVANYTKIDENSNERVNCKNGHWNFIPMTMNFDENTHTICRCDECDEIILEFKPFAVRLRKLN